MKTKDFYFDLPKDLIAQYPAEKRDASRLMHLSRKKNKLSHLMMTDLPGLLPKNTLVVFNNTKVRKARLFAHNSETGGKVEFFLLKRKAECIWECMVSKSKKQTPGKTYKFPNDISAVIKGDLNESLKLVEFSESIDDSWLDKYGHIPLPPYIKRDDETSDASRYQSLFARHTGSVAAPTASLHFSDSILTEIKNLGIEKAYITLHVGMGTFSPVRSEDITDHKMHTEEYIITEENALLINNALKDNRPVIAVGTTAVRTLESSFNGGSIVPGEGSTNIFIYPGYEFKTISGMFTNFHTPESTLLMLVSSFAGIDFIKESYQKAIENKYRFFSYGDAMLIL